MKTLAKAMFVSLLSAIVGTQAEGQGNERDKIYVINNATLTPLSISGWSIEGDQQPKAIDPPLKFNAPEGRYLPLASFPDASPEKIVLWGEEVGKPARALTNRYVQVSGRSQNIWVMNLKPLELKEAFDYLNEVRQAPQQFSQEIGADLSAVLPRKPLVWNATLAQVAQQKAQDMADRNYYGHLTPEGRGINIMIHQAGYTLADYLRPDDSANTFESVSAGRSAGKETVKNLILDASDPNLGHRKHLLGMADYSTCVDIGIGCGRNPNSMWKIYWCFIVAYHE